MSDIEQTIKIIERNCENCKANGIKECCQSCAQAFALQALKEKQERDKGCEYCTDLSRYKGFGYAEFFHQTAADECFEIGIDVKFCPNCGRKLDQPKEVPHDKT